MKIRSGLMRYHIGFNAVATVGIQLWIILFVNQVGKKRSCMVYLLSSLGLTAVIDARGIIKKDERIMEEYDEQACMKERDRCINCGHTIFDEDMAIPIRHEESSEWGHSFWIAYICSTKCKEIYE